SRLESWAEAVTEWCYLDQIVAIARSAPALETPTSVEQARGSSTPRCRIGLASDEAFHFYYDENLTRLEALGAQLVPFSPVRDSALPAVDGLYFGGGYPENSAHELSSNK